MLFFLPNKKKKISIKLFQKKTFCVKNLQKVFYNICSLHRKIN